MKSKVNLIHTLSGSETLEKIKGIELALAVIDVCIPGMNGFELALKINEERSDVKVPIIFLTARHVIEKQVFEGFGSGAIDFIFKPVNQHILQCKVNIFLDLFKQRQSIILNETRLKKSIAELADTNVILLKSEAKYRTLLNASPDGIVLTDLKGIITDISEIGLELFGAITNDELVGKNLFRFIPSSEKNTMQKIVEKTMNEGLIQNIEIKIKKQNQSFFLGEISATLIQGLDGAPLSFMIIIRDISQRKKMETKQINADRLSTLGEMASGIAHEINQPLNIISMVMDKILFESAKTETIDLEFIKNKSNKIFENIARIRNIIDHVRSFSRNNDDYVLTAFDINSSIENASSMITQQFKYLGINLILQLEKQIPRLFGNTNKFEQVILNLLTNAKDAVLEKKSKHEEIFDMIIGIRTYQENQKLIVEVTDNGIGISNVDINNIMLPFYTTKDEGKGTGLGLSICHQIIKDMGGTIDITSEKTNGTIIKLVLDIQKNN
ncbi:MAG: ATP-binding protein [Bacteroidales bacterium]|jgi:PAS domain S-box-containing protein|nr:ATP-binding protein [Bacteroidales bacterium]